VCREPIVEHRNSEELKAQRWTAAITTIESQGRGQAATGRRTVDANASSIDAQVVGVLTEPVERSETVV
jgi:hypothetical protein